MISKEQLRQSKSIQRKTGLTFYLATQLLPKDVRNATYVLYAFFRMADEIVDDVHPASPDTQRQELERIRSAALGEYDDEDSVLEAFAVVRDRHDIPRKEVDAFVDSMLMDIHKNCYQSHDDLELYLRGSAAAIGRMMLEIMDPLEKEPVRSHASALGKAFQLTNFLRDIREDVSKYDRVYIPVSTLTTFDVTTAAIENLRFSKGVARAIRSELVRTERFYRKGVAGIQYLPRECQFAVLLSAVLYADHHRLIRECDFDVLSRRPTLSMRRRLELLARTWLAWQYCNDPSTVFYRITDLAAPESDWDAEENELTDTIPTKLTNPL